MFYIYYSIVLVKYGFICFEMFFLCGIINREKLEMFCWIICLDFRLYK